MKGVEDRELLVNDQYRASTLFQIPEEALPKVTVAIVEDVERIYGKDHHLLDSDMELEAQLFAESLEFYGHEDPVLHDLVKDILLSCHLFDDDDCH